MPIVADFEETQTAGMLGGLHAEIRLDALPGTVIEGELGSFAPASDSEFRCFPANRRPATSHGSYGVCRSGLGFSPGRHMSGA